METLDDIEYDYHLVGRRFAHRRRQLGLTVAEVAKAADISRYTLMRIEKGLPAKNATIKRICHRLRIYTDQLRVRPVESENYVVHRHARTRWMVSMPKTTYSQVEGKPSPHVNDEEERHRLGRLGFQPFYTALLESELPEGTSSFGMMELHQPSWLDAHFGEEFIYALRGSVVITVGGDPCVLEEGDSICFDAHQPHSYAPATPLQEGQLAPQILIVVTASLHDRQLRQVEEPMPAPKVKKSQGK